MARYLAKLVFHRALVAGIITVALTILFSLPSSSTHADGTFDSTVENFFCNQLPSGFNGPVPLPGDPNCTGDFSPGANPDWGFRWDVPSGDYNFSTFATFMSDGFSIAADANIDDGAVVAGISVGVTLGIIGGFCGNTLAPNFILYDSTTVTSNTVDALPEGTPDRFSNLAIDGGDIFPGQADANSPAVLQYPSFLNTLLDPDLDYPGDSNDGPLDPISPWARYTGLTMVPPGGDWIFLTILVFEKDQLLAFTDDPHNATHPFARYGRNPDEAGWVHILILQDPTEIVGRVEQISDFCTPLNTDAMFLGQVTDTTHGTVNRLTSPAADTGIDGEGTHPLLLYALSVRDTDGDGLENSFDTCPFTANVEDPRVTDGPDLDMLDSACDPHAGAIDKDEDGDGFQNSQDNCPLVANVSQAQGEESTTYILAAPDGGFKDDSIGDACDSEGGGSDSVADGAFLHDMNTDAVCIATNSATSDPDGDGWCGASPGADPAPNDPNITGAPNIDTDGDGYPNDDELFMQTDPLVDCPLVSGSHDAWPSDFDGNRWINILDIVQLTPPTFNAKTGEPAYSQRRDLDGNGWINILDIVQLTPPVFNAKCTP